MQNHVEHKILEGVNKGLIIWNRSNYGHVGIQSTSNEIKKV